ncbi:hypothetical protein JD844_008630 [Phrynosoma platyrhinos]|uniref:Metaxin n=1 Tax=Phrynosoma platyrhinos TaxID=52577 RepID=A0ABQ7TE26_PHRPL|nr:hypothetical protein JD844_008630 [Phrynosoma platyrhinos]
MGAEEEAEPGRGFRGSKGWLPQDGVLHGTQLLGRRLGVAVRTRGVPRCHGDGGLAYARFSGAPLKVKVIDHSWRAQTGTVPLLILDDTVISQPAKILNFLRKQKYNADYELSTKEGADTLAYIALLEEKLHPAMMHTFWIEADNYYSVTKPWFASRIPFPLSWYLPRKMAGEALDRILLTKGGPPLFSIAEVEAQEWEKPTTLDSFVFGFLAPLYKVPFPKVQLQDHLKLLPNLCRFCDDILSCYFRLQLSGVSPVGQDTVDANLQKLTQLVNKESNLIEKMDDNLRKSPQHPPRKLTTLKLSKAGEGNSSPNRLSP